MRAKVLSFPVSSPHLTSVASISSCIWKQLPETTQQKGGGKWTETGLILGFLVNLKSRAINRIKTERTWGRLPAGWVDLSQRLRSSNKNCKLLSQRNQHWEQEKNATSDQKTYINVLEQHFQWEHYWFWRSGSFFCGTIGFTGPWALDSGSTPAINVV